MSPEESSQEILFPSHESAGVLPLPPLQIESARKSKLERRFGRVGHFVMNSATRRISFHGFDSVEEVFEYPELQKISDNDANKLRNHLEQAVAYRKGFSPVLDDEDEPAQPRMSIDSMAVQTTVSLLSRLQSVISHNKRDEKIADALYRVSATKVIKTIFNANESESVSDASSTWEAELDPRNIKALRKEIIDLAVQRGGKKETAISTLGAAGIYHIHPQLVAAYLGIDSEDWVQQLQGKKYVVPPIVLDKINFLIQLDTETIERKDVTFNGKLGESALDILIPAQADNSEHNIGDSFVAQRLQHYKQDLQRGRYKTKPTERTSSYKNRLLAERSALRTVGKKVIDDEISLKRRAELRARSVTQAVVKSLGGLTIRYSGLYTLFKTVQRKLRPENQPHSTPHKK